MIPCYGLHQHPCAVWFQRSKDVLSGTSRISQIMQYVKERDEIEIFGSVVFGRGDLEGCVSRNAILPRVHSCLLKRTGMEVISDETRLWKRLCHEPRLRTLFR